MAITRTGLSDKQFRRLKEIERQNQAFQKRQSQQEQPQKASVPEPTQDQNRKRKQAVQQASHTTTSTTLQPTRRDNQPIPGNIINMLRSQIQSGNTTPQQALTTAQGLLQGGQFSGDIEGVKRQLFAPLEDIQLPGGGTGVLDNNFTGEIVTTDKPARGPGQPEAEEVPPGQSSFITRTGLNEEQFNTAQKAFNMLPPNLQNQLRRGEIDPISSGNALRDDPQANNELSNNTEAGQNIQNATGGMDANAFLKGLETTLASTFRNELSDVQEARKDIKDFLNSRTSSEDILKEEFERRGIKRQTTMLSELDKQIQEQTKRLRELPDDVKSTLEDAGVTQSQLNRIVAKEVQKPTEVLRGLMEERNALSKDINRAVSFAERFAETRLEDQATKLAALEWELDQETSDLERVDDERRRIIKQGISEKKDVMSIALDNPQAGIDVDNDSVEEAIAKVQESPRSNSTFDIRSTPGGGIVQIERGPSGEVLGQEVIRAGTSGTSGGGEDSGNVFSIGDTGETIDVGTTEGIQRMSELGMSSSEIKAFLDDETDFTQSTIDGLIEEAGIGEKKKSVDIDQIKGKFSEAAGKLQNLEFDKGEARERLRAKARDELGLGKNAALPGSISGALEDALDEKYGTFFGTVAAGAKDIASRVGNFFNAE